MGLFSNAKNNAQRDREAKAKVDKLRMAKKAEDEKMSPAVRRDLNLIDYKYGGDGKRFW